MTIGTTIMVPTTVKDTKNSIYHGLDDVVLVNTSVKLSAVDNTMKLVIHDNAKLDQLLISINHNISSHATIIDALMHFWFVPVGKIITNKPDITS